MKKALWWLFIWMIAAGPAWALRLPASGGPKAYGYVMWHEKYLLFAARVEDSLLVGTSTETQVFPGNDDGIELCFDVSGAGGTHTVSRLAASVAGGVAVFSMDRNGRWRADNSWFQPPATLKLSVAPDGTLNNPSDTDRGFTVEAAIPWERLGGTPKPMALVGFNFLVRVRGENQGFASWAPGVMSEEDNEDPSRWGAMLLFPGARPTRAEEGVLSCPKNARVPFVDGKLGAEEWIGATVLTLEKPKPEFGPSPETGKERGEMPLLTALYRYDYRTNGAGSAIVSDPPLPVHQPREGLGPWWSAQRPGWHRQELKEIQAAGIEVLLAVYSPEREARADWARRGLAAMSEALRELQATGRPYPLVGMYLDTAGLARALGEPADLTAVRGQRILYGAIREFYQQIPPEFRAEIGAGKERGYPVVLGPPKGMGKWDEEFIKYANQAFSRDFGGAKLVWLADVGWKAQGLGGMEAYPPLSSSQPSGHDATGRAGIAVLSPGYGETVGPEMRSRGEGPDLREEWRRLLTLGPAYVILASWNDFVRGTYIAPSRQEGFTPVDTFSLLVSQEAEKVKRPVRLKKANLPAAIAPGGKAMAELVLANSSTEEIRSDERTGLDWRILDEEGKSTLVSKNDVEAFRLPPGGSVRLYTPIAALDSTDKYLPPGRYLIEFNLRRSSLAYIKASWLSHSLCAFRLPLLVEKPPEYAFTLLGSNLRSHLKSGAKYAVSVTLRNDGSKAWKKKEVRLCNQWYRVEDNLEISSPQQTRLVEGGGLAAALPREVAPGEIITLTAEVEASAGGNPLPAWQPGEMWHYGLGWVLEAGGSKIYAAKGTALEAVYVVEEDLGSHFVDSTTPAEMSAGKEYPVEVVITNAGPDSWPANEAELTYHWYYWDGSLARWETNSTPLPAEAKPGESIKVSAVVKAPVHGGPYFLVWDLKRGGSFASSSINPRTNETLRMPVMVSGGDCQQVDLSGYYNVIASASDRRRALGDLDGLGNCLPLEQMPPDLSGNTLDLYPSGYYLFQPENGLKGITFRYPAKNQGLQKAIACRGQSIALPQTAVSRLHLLGAGTGAGLSGTLTIAFADGHTQTLPLTISSWLEPASHGEGEGFVAPYMRTSRGDNPRQPVYLHHYVIDLGGPAEVSSLALPDNKEMKLFAITLEGPASAPSTALSAGESAPAK